MATKPVDARGITRVADDFLLSCAAQGGGLTAGQRALMSQMALELLSEARAARRKRLEES